MRILQIVSWYYPAKVGGVARIMYLLAKALVRQGHEVEVWTTDYLDGTDKVSPRRQTLDGIEVTYFPGMFHSLQRDTYQTHSLPWFWKIATESRRFDVVHMVESRATQVALYGTLLRLSRTPIVHSAFGALGEKRPLARYTIYDEIFLKPFLRQRVSRYLCQTEHEITSYVNLLGEDACEKAAIVPLGVEVAEARASAREHAGALRSQLPIEPDTPLVIYLGRLTPNKGVERLVRCFAAATAGTEAFLAIVGYDEGSKTSIESEIAKHNLQARCRILDSEHGPRRFGYYRDADIYAITSTYFEETSLASLEALSTGTPCLVTPEVELPYLEAYGAGQMPESSDEAITEALRKLLAEPSDLRRMRANALRLTDERYDIDAIASRLVEVYSQAGGRS